MKYHKKADLKIENKEYLENIIQLRKKNKVLKYLCAGEIIAILVLDLCCFL